MKKEAGTSTSSFGTSGRFNHDSSKFYNSRLYSEMDNVKLRDYSENQIPSEYLNHIILGSAENMKELPDNSVHLMMLVRNMMMIYRSKNTWCYSRMH